MKPKPTFPLQTHLALVFLLHHQTTISWKQMKVTRILKHLGAAAAVYYVFTVIRIFLALKARRRSGSLRH